MKKYTENKSALPSYSIKGALLDSSLIRQTDRMNYNAKIYQCGDYIQLYLYENTRIKKDTNLCLTRDDIQNKKLIFNEEKKGINKPIYKEIRFDNAIRSKLQIQRLIKANIRVFKTFITLTFEDNISIDKANEKFNSWRTHTKKIFPNFEYVSVPEFQKRGAVHYHLLTNINYDDILLVNQEVKKIWQPKNKEWHIFKTLIHWNNGFSSIKDLNVDNDNMNIVAYISKYVTKDIDNRLYGRKKYSYSKSLYVPKPTYFDIGTEKTTKYVREMLYNGKLNYHNIYLDKFNNQVKFKEFTINNIDLKIGS